MLKRNSKKGFTLAEHLIVVAIIAILVAKRAIMRMCVPFVALQSYICLSIAEKLFGIRMAKQRMQKAGK